MKMRILTTEEWDKLMDTVQEDNDRAHWKKMFSLVHDTNFEETSPSYRVARGYYSTRHFTWYSSGGRHSRLGFRPAFDILETNALASGLQNGDSMVIGTLYMGNEPVKVPQNPVYDGDITNYIPSTKLEMREALTDPAYQVTAIKVGNILIADRCLVQNISYDDIQAACIDGYNHELTNIEDICPLCGAEIEYQGDQELDDSGSVVSWECPKCGATGKAGYNLVFDAHYQVCDANGNPVE